MSVFLGVGHRRGIGSRAPVAMPTGFLADVDASSPTSHVRLGDTGPLERVGSHSAAYVNGPTTGIAGLADDGAALSIGLKGGATPPHLTLTDWVTSATFAVGGMDQLDDVPGGTKMALAALGAAGAAGEYSVEVQDDGQGGAWLRVFSYDSGGTPVVRTTPAGSVPVGPAFMWTYARDAADGSQQVWIDGVEQTLSVETGAQPASWPVPPTGTNYCGVWADGGSLPLRGLMGERFAWS